MKKTKNEKNFLNFFQGSFVGRLGKKLTKSEEEKIIRALRRKK
jgi:hypothetical protein